MTPLIDTLNRRFRVTGRLQFVDNGHGLPVAEIQTAQASARLALQGAQVLAWQPAGHLPVIWLSQAAVFEPGQAVRGGVPVCWPWFGARAGLPAHGFVRTRLWELRDVSEDLAQPMVLRLGLRDDDSTRALWDFAFDLELVVTVGATLTLALTTRNTGDQAFTLTQALHSYFCVGDIAQTSVQGLDGTDYLDKVQDFALARQTGPLEFRGETDRIYINTRADCRIEDRLWQRRLQVAKTGSSSTVVWNPGREREQTLPDMAAGAYRGMLCVETCNAGPDQISVAPGCAHTLSACISVA